MTRASHLFKHGSCVVCTSHLRASLGLGSVLQQVVERAVVVSLGVGGVSRFVPQVGLLVPPFFRLAVEIFQRVVTDTNTNKI